MLMRALLTVAALGLAAGPLMAQDSTQSPAQPVADKKICRQIVPTGSMMPKRFCLTKSEWREFASTNDKAVSAMRDRKSPNMSLLGRDF